VRCTVDRIDREPAAFGLRPSLLVPRAVPRAWDRQKLATAPTAPLLEDAFAIAAAFERTVRDGLCVALAVHANMPLVAADERLAHALAARFPIRWLGAP
jgi:predicted nucleic acid-binding protein